jgi:RNA polymerase sigma factor (sigma-70 family)
LVRPVNTFPGMKPEYGKTRFVYMNSYIHNNENVLLWNEFRNGDINAFSKLMRKYYRDLFNYATRFTKDKELVKDCIQELFLTLWVNRQTINTTSYVRYYLLKSLRRRLVKSLCDNIYANINCDDFRFNAGFDESVENKIILAENYSELSQTMRNLVASLSKREQEVIYLRFYVDADYYEIAEIMCINKQSAYNLLCEALRKLKKVLLTTESFA